MLHSFSKKPSRLSRSVFRWELYLLTSQNSQNKNVNLKLFTYTNLLTTIDLSLKSMELNFCFGIYFHLELIFKVRKRIVMRKNSFRQISFRRTSNITIRATLSFLMPCSFKTQAIMTLHAFLLFITCQLLYLLWKYNVVVSYRL